MTRAPLRFLTAVLVLWTGARVAILLPDWAGEMVNVPAADATEPRESAAPSLAPVAAPIAIAANQPRPLPAHVVGQETWPTILRRTASAPAGTAPGATLRVRQLSFRLSSKARFAVRSGQGRTPAFGVVPPSPDQPGERHWSASAWLLVRDRGDAALAPGGTLGGSQAGARVNYALGGGVSLSARAYLPLRHTSGAELAVGIDWRPVRFLPVSLIAERRQRLGRDGRTALAITAYGGGSRDLSPHIRLDVYGQAGIVGLRSRDLFADGALRVSRRIGPVELGAGAWGAAQPGAARLDTGQSLSWRLPARANLRLQADWRFRIAGEAAPASGPALTLAADF